MCSKNRTFLYIICILDPFGPSHEVEGCIKQCLCLFSVPFEKCYIFPTKNRFLLKKNGGTVEVTLCRLVFIGLQNRLCGPLLCSKNNALLYIICMLDPFGPSHEVQGHFKQCLCLFSVPFEKCYIFPTKSRYLPRKNGGTARSDWAAWSLLGSKIGFVGHCCVQKILHFFT